MRKAIGALYEGNQTCTFRLWAPDHKKVELILEKPEKKIPLEKDEWGYWSATLHEVEPGRTYWFLLDGKKKRPDPASRAQLNGVHEASTVIDPGYAWKEDGWTGMPLEEMIIYELHPGTFSEKGNFRGIEEKLDYLLDLGITAIEVMPVAQFPGSRNWGYDGVYPFAVQDSYGGVEGLKHLVDACHQKGMAVILDVVYNHLGPEGNYMADFGPYFTEKYNTPWGAALNFDDAYCDHVRNFFIENALMWFHEFHIDALRLDAIHAIFDDSAHPFLQQLGDRVKELSEKDGRQYLLIAESDMNDVKVLKTSEEGGFGHDGQWCDDFHHALHTQLTGEKDGYYHDFHSLTALEKAYEDSFVYDWRYSEYRKKTFGSDARPFHPKRFVVCAQNHDQIGNRMLGDRMSTLTSFEALKLSAAALLFSPYTPMLFMGEEYGEKRPFQYFISHTDPDLVQAVREGRKREFKAFGWETDPPDPQAVATFDACRLTFDRSKPEAEALFSLYKSLIKMRKTHPVLKERERSTLQAKREGDALLVVQRATEAGEVIILLNFGDDVNWDGLSGAWNVLLDTAAEKWSGPGSSNHPELKNASVTVQAQSAMVLEKTS